MKARTTGRLAWSTFLSSAAIAGGSLLLLALGVPARAAWASASGPVADVVAIFVLLTFAAVGALIASRRPENAVGWIFCAAGLVLEAWFLAQRYASFALLERPGSLPFGVAMAWLFNWLLLPGLGLAFSFLFLLFPNGRPPSPRWRPVTWFAGVAISAAAAVTAFAPGPLSSFHFIDNPLGIVALQGLDTDSFAWLLLLISVLASVISLPFRLVRARGEERKQIQWLAFAAAVMGVAFIATTVASGGSRAAQAVADVMFTIGVTAVPIACAVAIFRYRLYDIDLVISKTVVFGALGAFITAVYVGVVVGLGELLGTRGEPSVGLSILATAIVAVAFQPVRERVQRLANRLVYGRRATPYEVLSAFSSRMGGTYASEELLPRMARILAKGTGASSAEVWLNVDDEVSRAAAWPQASGGTERLRISNGELPAFETATRAVPVTHRGELLGALTVAKPPGEPLAPAEDKLLSDLAAQAGLVLRNVRLIEELRASRQRLVTAQDAERRRLERDIHDGAQQRLAALAVKFRLLEGLADDAPEKEMLSGLRTETTEALEELRDLARGIYPPILAEKGLVAALQAQARRAPLPVEIEAAGIDRYSQEIEAAVYFCCLEALQNVAKYANASRAHVHLSEGGGQLRFSVGDDGVGFDPEAAARGSGLQNMADRVEALGGSLEVRSSPGGGTTVSGRVPARTLEPVP